MRRSFSRASALSLVLGLAGLGLWVRSYLFDDLQVRSAAGRLLLIESNAGISHAFHVWFADPTDGSYVGPRELLNQLERNGVVHGELQTNVARRRSFLGVVLYTDATAGAAPPLYRVTSIPYAYLVLPTLVLPLAWLVRRLRRTARARRGHCRNCGYDLRASTGRCPECGLVIPQPA